jgi:hypothetical protein
VVSSTALGSPGRPLKGGSAKGVRMQLEPVVATDEAAPAAPSAPTLWNKSSREAAEGQQAAPPKDQVFVGVNP